MLRKVVRNFSLLKWQDSQNPSPMTTNNKLSGGTSNKLQDYEVCDNIQYEISKGRPMQAFKLLVESQLHGTILDLQTFNDVANGLKHNRNHSSFTEIVYQLLRIHFKPSVLMHPHMKALLKSENTDFCQLLKKDIEYLSASISQIQDIEPQQNEPQLEEGIQQSSQNTGGDSLKFSNLQEMAEGLREVMSNAESVVLHDVHINLDKSSRITGRITSVQQSGDWLETFNKENRLQESEQEGGIRQGVSIGKIEIKPKKQ